MILALSATTTVPLIMWMGRAAGTVTLTARYSLATVSVTGTVAVVSDAANAAVAKESASIRARMNAVSDLCFIFPSFQQNKAA